MGISKSEFKNAFREVVSSEFSFIPDNESSVDYSFSEKFNKRMQKLIKSQKKVYWSFVNTTKKRFAIVCLVIVMLLSTACSVKEIREPIINFITEIYETFVQYTFEGDTTEKITSEYVLNELPDGFRQSNIVRNDISITTTYEDLLGNIIEFTQTITKNSDFNVDCERGKSYIETVANTKVSIYDSNELKLIMWAKNGCYFTITYFGDVDIDTVKSMVEAVELS